MKLGRPLKYETPEELEDAICAYFDDLRPDQPPTISGLALYLGFEDRHSIYDYKERPDFSHIIKRAVLFMESYAEEQLLRGTSATGAIFWLKNHKWTDKVVNDVNITGYSLFDSKTEEKAKKYERKPVK